MGWTKHFFFMFKKGLFGLDWIRKLGFSCSVSCRTRDSIINFKEQNPLEQGLWITVTQGRKGCWFWLGVVKATGFDGLKYIDLNCI